MSDRETHYSDDKKFRVVSRPGGAWTAQRVTGDGHGTKTADPWTDICRPTTRENAVARMTAAAR